ncbi:MAG: matrixin family metalloprotease [Sandaracinaceae bacterium]
MRRTHLAWLVLLVTSPAHAWAPLTSSRPTWDDAHVAWSLHDRGSDDLDFATVQTDVRRGMEDWTRVSCTGFSTTYEGTTSTAPRGGDGQFIVGWVESGWSHSSSAIGVTGTRFTSSRLVEADMEMNGVHFTWTTDPGSGSRVNLYSIALHEGGHFFGLGHSSDRGAAMYFAYSGGVSTLGADDEAGICALYPGSGGGATDCATTGCPSGERCVDGSCTPDTPPAPGGDAVCAPCLENADCGGSGDYCLGYPDGNGYCGAACASAADCGGGERCSTLSNGARQCVRFVDGGASCGGAAPPPAPECAVDADCGAGERCAAGSCVPSGAGLGDPCARHDDCGAGACLAGVCTQSCDWPGGACPDGFYCDGGATGACGPGACLPGRAGPGADGDPCGAHTDCGSLHCFAGRCGTACDPSTVGACPGGGICQVGELACRGACGVTGSLGDPCAGNPDCASGLCASRDGDGFCTEICDPSSPCGPGFRCVADGAVSVCVPDGGALGQRCGGNGDCASGICAVEETRTYCTRICDPSSPCPSAMRCVPSGTPGISVCQPGGEQAEGERRGLVGSCSISGGSDGGGPLGALLVLLWLTWRAGRTRRLSPPG